MSEFVIREATDDDGPALARLLATAWADYEGCAFEAADHPLLEHPASHFTDRDGRLWIVLRDGEAAGSLGLARHARQGEFELSLICLDRQSRGQGLSAALLAGADAFAAASGASRLNLWIDARLVDGVRFLERHGFDRDPGVRGRHDGSRAVERHFSRSVAPAAQPAVSSPLSEDRPGAGA